MRLLISAGEASGEKYGALLIEELRRHAAAAPFECFGMGGERMRAAGCELLVHSQDVAVVGITEVIAQIPRVYSHFRRMVRELGRRPADAAVLIDFPDFNLRLAKELKHRGIPVIYFVSPQLWAWKKRRIHRVRKYVDQMLVIFPFEEKYYRERGVNAEFIGHPLADLPQPAITREEFAARYGIDNRKKWVGLLPGSRRKEVLLNLPIMLEAAQMLGEAYEFILPVASTLDPSWLRSLLPHDLNVKIYLVDDARVALHHSKASIVASGTATVEAALMGNPFVVVYRVSPLTYAIGRKFVRLPHYSMVNLIAGMRVVPELIQKEFTAENILKHIAPHLREGTSTHLSMVRDLHDIRGKLMSRSSQQTAISRVAETVLNVIKARNRA